MKHIFYTILLLLLSTAAMAQQDERDYATLVKQGIAALERDSLSQAEHLFLRAIAVRPAESTNAVLYQYIGEVRARMGRLDEALEAYNRGLGLLPMSQELLLDRASLHLQRDDLDRALTDLDELLALNSGHI